MCETKQSTEVKCEDKIIAEYSHNPHQALRAIFHELKTFYVVITEHRACLCAKR